ncbi:MAG: aminopeptidase P family protein [Chloroflexi bacterium]|nr:aminopeptidase P family protein [Chloroflexota bacterium]
MVLTRIGHVRELMAQENLDGLLVTDDYNRYYLSGFSGSAGAILITPQEQLLLVDFRYWEQAERETKNLEIVRLQGKLQERLPELFQSLALQNVGIEAETVTVAQLAQWKRVMPANLALRPTNGLVENLRQVKDTDELAAIRRAVALTDRAFAFLCETVAPGMSEAKIAWELEIYLRSHGSNGLAFEPIVASGPNAALPHARPSERTVAEGEPILFDFGARVGHYCADLSRTICLGTPPAQLVEIFALVKRAQQAALDGIHAGQPVQQADALARDVIRDAGYDEQFGHGLGHGIGLDVHESPRVSAHSDETLLAGMVITVEPGIYLPDWGGVRIEDTVVVHGEGVESLSKAPKTLVSHR